MRRRPDRWLRRGQQLAQALSRSKRTCVSAWRVVTPTIESERERCRADIKTSEEAQAVARQTEEQTRRAVEAIDASDRAALAREAMNCCGSVPFSHQTVDEAEAGLRITSTGCTPFPRTGAGPMMMKAPRIFTGHWGDL